MNTIQLYKVSMAASSKSGGFAPRNSNSSRTFFQKINSGLKNDAIPEFPEHELIMPRGGWFEDFILGEFGNPYVSARVVELMKQEWPNEFEFVRLGQLLGVDYFILVVRPALKPAENRPFIKCGYIDSAVFDDAELFNKSLFRVQGMDNVLYATNLFGEFIRRNQLTGVYLRDPEALLMRENLPFGLPIMKNGKKPQLNI